MEYLIIGLIIVCVATGSIILWQNLSHHKKTGNQLVPKGNILPSMNYNSSDEMNSLMIQLEQLPIEAILDKSKLIELADSKLLAHIGCFFYNKSSCKSTSKSFSS